MDETADLMVEALQGLGLDSVVEDRPDGRADVVIDPGATEVPVELERYSLVDEARAHRIMRSLAPARSRTLVVVGDRVTFEARRLLLASGVGYLDIRGHLGIRTDRLVIVSSFEPPTRSGSQSDPLSGSARMEIAAAVLMQTEGDTVSVRELARRLGRSPSTVSDALAGFRDAKLTNNENQPRGIALFRSLADRWGRATRTYLAATPSSGDSSTTRALGLGLSSVADTPGWALTDTAAAAVYGAPVAARANQVLDFLLPSESSFRRALTLLDRADSLAGARCSVRVAPIRAACEQRVDLDSNYYEWPLTHPLFVALDLAQDSGRGREILEMWTPDGPWRRVW